MPNMLLHAHDKINNISWFRKPLSYSFGYFFCRCCFFVIAAARSVRVRRSVSGPLLFYFSPRAFSGLMFFCRQVFCFVLLRCVSLFVDETAIAPGTT